LKITDFSKKKIVKFFQVIFFASQEKKMIKSTFLNASIFPKKIYVEETSKVLSRKQDDFYFFVCVFSICRKMIKSTFLNASIFPKKFMLRRLLKF
jgi:hypothetical protein